MSESEHTICVVIVNFNSEDYIEDCLDALEQQLRAADHIIIIDNASTDQSINIIKAHSLEIELIENKANLGFAAANNQAASCASAYTWLALLNPDTQADPNWLQELEKATFQHSNFSSFASLQLNAEDPAKCDGAGDTYHAIGYAWRRAHNTPAARVSAEVKEVFSACAAAWLVRRELFTQSGGFDEDFFCYCEDVDLGYRLRLGGHATLFVPTAAVHHRASSASGLDSDFSIYHGQRNLVWVFLKNTPLPLLLLMLLPNVAFHLVGVLRFVKMGKGRVALRAKRDALRALPAMLSKRRLIQGTIRKQTALQCLPWLEFSPLKLIDRLRGSRA